jgi:NAD(P)-dependent dehydrogenase (short-subunit alcohol dehydrogenase family)
MSTLALDVTNAESIARCRDEVESLTDGKLDILINNAYVLPLQHSYLLRTRADTHSFIVELRMSSQL